MSKTFFVLFGSAAASAAMCLAAAPKATPLGACAQSLEAPARVAADAAGNLYVTDPQAGRVVVFDAFGRPAAMRDGFAGPLGIAVDRQGRIYLAEEQPGSVSVFDAQWTFLFKLGAGNGEFRLPSHIALDASNAVYVSDGRADAIKVYAGTTLIGQFGTHGTGDGQFRFPAGVAVSANGEVFVLDQDNDRIQVFTASGDFLRKYDLGRYDALDERWVPAGRKQGLVVDAGGRLYVADSYQGVVKVYDAASGASLSAVGSFGERRGQLNVPAGIALDPFNRLFVAAANNARVEMFGLEAFLHLASEPAASTVAVGTNLVLSAIAGGAGPFSYQWSKDGADIADATNAALAIGSVAGGDAGAYSVVVSGPAGALTSSVAQVAVLAPPYIMTDPLSQTVLRGANVELAVSAAGSLLSFQWQYNGRNMEGATKGALSLPDVQTFQAGVYSVEVRNSVGAVLSAPASLAVLAPPTVMEILSCAGQSDQQFLVTVNVDPGYTFALDVSTNLLQWEPSARFFNDAGLVDLLDGDAASYAQRFYRIRWVP